MGLLLLVERFLLEVIGKEFSISHLELEIARVLAVELRPALLELKLHHVFYNDSIDSNQLKARLNFRASTLPVSLHSRHEWVAVEGDAELLV